MNSSLVWDGFSRAASLCFERAFNSKQYQDVTLISEDCQQFGAHRMILSSSSEKFEKILHLRSGDSHPAVFLRGVTARQVSSLLRFIYEGKVNVPTEDLRKFISLVTEFKIDGLKSEGDISGDSDETGEKEMTDVATLHEETRSLEKDINEHNLMEETVTGDGEACKVELKDTDISMTDEAIEDPFEDKERAISLDDKKVKESEAAGQTIREKVKSASSTETFLQSSYFESLEFLESSQRQDDGHHHCMKCNYKTKRRELLRTHMSSTHDGPKFVCPREVCRRVYSSKANLRSHMRSCHNCDKCDQIFDSNNDLKMHKKTVHNCFF